MKIATTVDGVLHLQRAALGDEKARLPIRHFVMLLVCRKDAMEIEQVYKKVCKERLVQFTYPDFVHDVKVLERKGWLRQCQ